MARPSTPRGNRKRGLPNVACSRLCEGASNRGLGAKVYNNAAKSKLAGENEGIAADKSPARRDLPQRGQGVGVYECVRPYTREGDSGLGCPRTIPG